MAGTGNRLIYQIISPLINCICRRKNRSCTDFEPHLAGKITAVFHMDFWEFYVENHVENRYNYF